MQNIPPLASLDNFFELPFRDLIGELFLTILLFMYASKSGVRQTHVGRKLCDSARALAMYARVRFSSIYKRRMRGLSSSHYCRESCRCKLVEEAT